MIKIWHVTVREGMDGSMFLDMSDVLDDIGWAHGDQLVFIKKEDGSILIQKKASPNSSSSSGSSQ